MDNLLVWMMQLSIGKYRNIGFHNFVKKDGSLLNVSIYWGALAWLVWE